MPILGFEGEGQPRIGESWGGAEGEGGQSIQLDVTLSGQVRAGFISPRCPGWGKRTALFQPQGRGL